MVLSRIAILLFGLDALMLKPGTREISAVAAAIPVLTAQVPGEPALVRGVPWQKSPMHSEQFSQLPRSTLQSYVSLLEVFQDYVLFSAF